MVDILPTLEDYKVLDIPLIQTMFYPTASGERIAQARMKKLFTQGKVKRWRGENGYVYGERRSQWEHTLMVNYVRQWLSPSPWEKVHCFQYNYDLSILKADGFLAFKNDVSKGFRFVFVEAERHSDRNQFDKVKKYNLLYEAINHGKEMWWSKLSEKFPKTYIVCETEGRCKKALQSIQEDNTNGLRFEIVLLNDIRRALIDKSGVTG